MRSILCLFYCACRADTSLAWQWPAKTIRRWRAAFRCTLLPLLILLPVAPLAHAETAHLLVLGDSLSAGYGIDPAEGWVTLLQERVDETYPDTYTVINASISGDTTSGGKARLTKLLQTYAPEIVILELGGNDGLRGQPLKLMQRNLETLVETAVDSGARVLLLGMQIPPNYGERYSGAFAAIYAEIASDYNIPLVPFFLDGVALKSEFMQGDGIHPNADAQPTLLNNI